MLNNDRFSNAETIDRNTRAIRDKELRSQQKKRKYLLMAISLIISISLWLYVVNEENPTIKQTFYDVHVEFLNKELLEKNGLVMTADDTPPVRVVLEAKRSRLKNLSDKDIVAYIDLSEYEAGENYVNVKVNVPYSTELVSVNPSQLKLSIEKIISEKKDIKVTFKGKVEEGYEPHSDKLSRETVTISGASSSISKVAYISAMVDVEKLRVNKSTQSILLVPVDKNGKKVSGITLDKDNVDVVAQLYMIRNVPLVVKTSGNPEVGFILNSCEAPNQIMISGPEEEVKGIKSIDAETINISGISTSKEFELSPKLLGNIVLAKSQNPLKCKVNIEKEAVSEKSFTYGEEAISLENVPENMKAQLLEPVVLKVIGSEEQLQKIQQEDFKLSIDCSQLKMGKEKVNLHVTMSENAKTRNIKAENVYGEVKLEEIEEQ